MKSYNFELHQFRKALSNQIQCENKKLAVEKLEELYELFFKLTDIDFEDKLVEMINELKGDK